MDFLIAAHGVHQGGLVAGETRGIEDDHVVVRLRVFQEIEDVVFQHFDFHVVEHGVFPGSLASAGGDIDGGDLGRTGLGAGEGEASLVGEAVEHALALGEGGDFGMGLELVQIEAGFLAVVEIDFENQAVGIDLEGARVFAVQHFDARFHALSLAVGRVVTEDDRFGIEKLDECVADGFLPQVHGEREGLDGKMVAVAVDDQTGEAVGFGPDESGQRVVDARVFPMVDGLADTAGEEIEIEILLPAGEPAGDNLGKRIVDGGAQRAVAEILERDDITGFRVTEGFLDLSGIDPLVTVKNARAGRNDEAGHGAEMSDGARRLVECETMGAGSRARFPLDPARPSPYGGG